MNDVIFRQYDIRGKVGTDFPIADAYRIGQAIAFYFKQRKPNIKTIAVGMDGRTHSAAIKELLCKALQESGIDVLFIGMCPTPVLYFSLFNVPVDGGLMITASHNGKEYNGIKMCLGKESVWGEQIQEIKKLMHSGAAIKNAQHGVYKEKAVIPSYIAWMCDHFPHLRGMDMKAVVDCGNGAAGTVLPDLVRAMKWPNIQLLYPAVDGTYPNHEADPTVEHNMLEVRHVLKTTDTQLGAGLDGDCDRMAAMSKSGELVQGDKLLALFAREIIKDHAHAKIVFDIKCSSALIELLSSWQAVPVMSPSGHSIIKNQMKQNNALLAGELSCHFFFSDRYFGYDDGIYALLRLFELLGKSKKTLDDLLKIFPHKFSTREIRIECAPEKQEKIMHHALEELKRRTDAQLITIDGIRATFPYGWGILRSSNTQPVLSVRFEGNSPQDLERLKKDFSELLKPFIDSTVLQREFSL
ncbi:MAG TPA: phosphomannomutase/phosphoglucomutase [Candidatus Babeliales bacterium]|nr:phosphomannomutase/phosphoglucomutase [Candidatus Babeliales bacterium]